MLKHVISHFLNTRQLKKKEKEKSGRDKKLMDVATTSHLNKNWFCWIRNRRNVVKCDYDSVIASHVSAFRTALICPGFLHDSLMGTDLHCIFFVCFFFLPASWRWWRSLFLSSPQCLVCQRLTPRWRDLIPSGSQVEYGVSQKTPGSPPVSTTKQKQNKSTEFCVK